MCSTVPKAKVHFFYGTTTGDLTVHGITLENILTDTIMKYITSRYHIPNPGGPGSKPLGSSKVDSVSHPHKVN